MSEKAIPEVEFARMPMAKLAPAAYNPREIDDESLRGLGVSIDRFGLVQPIVWNKRTGRIVGGHQRVKHLIARGTSHADVAIVDLPESEEKALNVALNNPHVAGKFTDDLQSLLAEIREDESALFADLRLDLLLGDSAIPPDGSGSSNEPRDAAPDDPADDDQPETVEPVSKPGESIKIGDHVLHCGDCLAVMRSMADGSVDAIVTDPPYGLGFMGKDWDVSVPGIEWAKECLRVLKPGGHIVAFGGTRTVHRLAVAIEDAGFEIRDMISWLHWQGFPKSLDVSKAIDEAAGAERKVISSRSGPVPGTHGGSGSYGHGSDRSITAPATGDAKRWAGWGTALKPSQEPAVFARKPLASASVYQNVLEHGTGAINIDGCRFAPGDPAWPGPQEGDLLGTGTKCSFFPGPCLGHESKGRFRKVVHVQNETVARFPANIFHCPKPATAERNDGTGDLPVRVKEQLIGAFFQSEMQNFHPTVKPVALMRWLVRLVTPPGGTVLDTFVGSGTTIIAAERERLRCIAIEREPGYCDIAAARGRYAVSPATRSRETCIDSKDPL